ncbi:MAG TPA: CrcB family protein [Acidimicrobiales bacterium]|nr:CrcB family protein [Acidimicrobiales bacterium]
MPDDRPALPIDPDLDPGDPAEPTVGSAGPAAGPAGALRRRPRDRFPADVLVAIAAGGMVGASARYGIARWLPVESGRFPWATFWTNLSGSFVLGVVLVLVLERFPPTRYVRPFAATGVIGAFTTMSTYEVETALLLKDGHPLTAVTYALGSLVAGLALAYAGIRAGRLGAPS